MIDQRDPGPGTDSRNVVKKETRSISVLPWIKALLGLVGLGLFIYLLNRVGLGNILDNVRRLGFWFLLIFLVEAGRIFMQACGWSTIHNAFFKTIPLKTLFRIKIISDNFNFAIPSASLGGDAVRTLMIKKIIPLKDGIPSVLFDKTFEYIGSTAFLMICFFLGLLSAGLPDSLTIPLLTGLGVTTVGIVLLVFVQSRGVARTLWRVSRFIPRFRRWVKSREEQLREIDANFQLLYSHRRSKALMAGFFHLCSRLIGTMEVLIVLWVLKAPVNLVQAMLIAAVVTAVNTAFFVLPGQLGVMESAHIMILKTFGYPPEIGLSLSMIRRIRRLAFVGLAMILFFVKQKKVPE
jgi:uncharacterized protein (TIRG00374 family)